MANLDMIPTIEIHDSSSEDDVPQKVSKFIMKQLYFNFFHQF